MDETCPHTPDEWLLASPDCPQSELHPCRHGSLDECYRSERGFYPKAVLHCNDCDRRERFEWGTHPFEVNSNYETPCTEEGCHGLLHWLWACNGEIVYDDHSRAPDMLHATSDIMHEHPIILQ